MFNAYGSTSDLLNKKNNVVTGFLHERAASVRDVPRSPKEVNEFPEEAQLRVHMPEYSDYEPILPTSKIIH